MPLPYATGRTTARRLRALAALTVVLVVGFGSPAWAQSTPQELVVEELNPGDRFGVAVAAAATSIAVGAPSASTAESAVYLFEGQAGKWVLTTAFNSTSPVERNLFGAAVALEEDVIVIGAPGTNHDEGAVYVYERNLGSWILCATLTPSTTQQEFFGTAVAISGNVIVVAAADNNPVSVFLGQNGTWELVTELKPGGPATAESLAAVAVNGATIAATGTSQFGTAVFGFESQDGGASWQEIGQFGPPPQADSFGVAVALDVDALLIGATTPGVQEPGNAYLYTQSSQGSNTLEFDAGSGQSGFGAAVAIDSSLAVIGAPLSQVGQNSEQGTVTVRAQNQGGPNGWGVVTTLVGPNGESGDAFGAAVAVEGSHVVVGAPGKNSQTGAAYAYMVTAGGPGGPQPTATPTAASRPGDDDGCAVTPRGSDSGVGLVLLAIPLLIALRRRCCRRPRCQPRSPHQNCSTVSEPVSSTCGCRRAMGTGISSRVSMIT
jgi:hypothetical protein